MSQFLDATSDARTLLSAALARFPDLDNPETLPYRDDILANSLRRHPDVWLSHPARLITLAGTSLPTERGYTHPVAAALITVIRHNSGTPDALRDTILAQVIRSHTTTATTTGINMDPNVWGAIRDYQRTLPPTVEDALLALPHDALAHALTSSYLATGTLSEPATQAILDRRDPKLLTPLARSPHPKILRQLTPLMLSDKDGQRSLDYLIANTHLPTDCLIDIATPAITVTRDVSRLFSITSHALRDTRPELTVIPDLAIQHLTEAINSNGTALQQTLQSRYLNSLLTALLTTKHATAAWLLAHHASALTAGKWTPSSDFYRAATTSTHLPTDIRLTAADHLPAWLNPQRHSGCTGVDIARELLREPATPATLIDRVLTILRDAKAFPAALELIQHPSLTPDQLSGYAKGGSRLARAARERLNPTVATTAAPPATAAIRPPDSLSSLTRRLTSDTVTDLASVVTTLSGFLNGTAPLSDRRAAALALTDIVNAHPHLAAAIPAPALAACAKFRDRLPLSAAVLEVLTQSDSPEAARLVSRSVMQSMNLLSA